MEYRRLGHSGLKVSALSLGSWITFGGAMARGEVRELVARASDAGINLFDSAENYAFGAAESLLGDVLTDLRLPRDSYCVSSKAFFGPVAAPAPTQRGLSRKHLREACDNALQRLRVDYLDLFFCHRPDPDTPLEETVQAMDQLVRAGKVLYWGTSEWPAKSICAAARFARSHGLIGPSMEQSQYNLLWRERVELEYASLYDELGLGLTVWSPLASGLLSGKYAGGRVPADSRLAHLRNGWTPDFLQAGARARLAPVVAHLVRLARELDCTPASLAIAWCLRNPKVSSVILGCSSPAQLDENLSALNLGARLDAGILSQLDAMGA